MTRLRQALWEAWWTSFVLAGLLMVSFGACWLVNVALDLLGVPPAPW